MLTASKEGPKMCWHSLEIMAHNHPLLLGSKGKYLKIRLSSQANGRNCFKFDKGLASSQPLDDLRLKVFISLEADSLTHKVDA
jgi:hypothetical protein